MTPQELREKRSKLLFDAHAIMSGSDVTAEQRTNVDRMLADANTLQQDAQRLEQLEAFAAEQRSRPGRVPRGAPGASGEGAEPEADTRTFEVRRNAANKALRTYLGASDLIQATGFEKRDLSIASNGGVMIPVGVSDPKIALKSYGSVYDLVNKMRTMTGEAIKVPFLNDTTQGFVLNSASITTTDPGTGGVTISIDDIRMNPILIEHSLMQDISYDLVGFVERACQTRYLRTLSNWITGGNTSNVAALTGYNAGVTSTTTLVTKYVDFTALLGALDPAYAIGANFLMSNTTLASQVLNILDSNNRPIFLPFNDGGSSGFAGTIMGYPVKLNPFQPGVGVGNIYIQFGNFEAGYTLREIAAYPDAITGSSIPGVGTITLRRLDERYAELNKVGFVAFARVGGALTNPGSVSSSPAPVVALIGR